MNFYEHQDSALRRTAQLLVLFAFAVAVIVGAINSLLFVALRTRASAPQDWLSWLTSSYGLATSGAVLGLIAAGSGYTALRLAGGGKSLAAMVGARALAVNAGDARERQLRNVVEEMSIASGTPLPALYVLDDESAINAFVAGTRPTEAVLVVTRGALESLTRDELQGVVAHEYSHILHEDMRINLRLMGILAGILLISRLGRGLMRAGGSSSGKRAGQAALLGLALFVTGYLGVLLGSMIQAAVCRQREFLADASAVQFTRNPDGIAAALYRIGQTGGSRLRSAHAGDLAHFCFGEALRPTLAGLFATHPPLAARIAAIAPDFKPPIAGAREPPATLVVPSAGHAANVTLGASLAPATVAAAVGRFAPRERATSLRDSLPLPLLEAARGKAPVALVYALLLAATPAQIHDAGLTAVRQHDCAATAEDVQRLMPAFVGLADSVRLPLLNLALPRLQALALEERTRVCHTVAAVIEADGQLSFFEFALQRILEDHLAVDAGRAPSVRHYGFSTVDTQLRTVFACLAWAGGHDEAVARRAFRRAYLPFNPREASLPARSTVTAKSLGAALAELASLTPLLKHNVISACADCAIEDGRVAAGETELLAAIALSLDCPMPPLLTTAAPS